MKYRKKPIVIEAFQFGIDKTPSWFDTSFLGNGSYCYIDTLEGEMRANIGDWIIKGIKGELYPIKDDIFRETYEAVE